MHRTVPLFLLMGGEVVIAIVGFRIARWMWRGARDDGRPGTEIPPFPGRPNPAPPQLHGIDDAADDALDGRLDLAA